MATETRLGLKEFVTAIGRMNKNDDLLLCRHTGDYKILRTGGPSTFGPELRGLPMPLLTTCVDTIIMAAKKADIKIRLCSGEGI